MKILRRDGGSIDQRSLILGCLAALADERVEIQIVPVMAERNSCGISHGCFLHPSERFGATNYFPDQSRFLSGRSIAVGIWIIRHRQPGADHKCFSRIE